MKWLTLEQIKHQLRLEQDYTLEDEVLEMYGASAERQVLGDIGRTFVELMAQYGAVPEDLVHATLLLVDHSYRQRSAADTMSWASVPYAYEAKIKKYMRLADRTDAQTVQQVTMGSDVKIAFTADMPDGLLLKDVEFSVRVMNADNPDTHTDIPKQDCIMQDDGAAYVCLVDSDTLGIGPVMLRLTVHIPDNDYPSGYRREVVNINPYIEITG